ncbi:TonB-dependent receptor [uncultured Sphingomonas sp.]|uniref:TonB-dependent receptor n=1 Tax=uncultured Sphingomonas sp. TaxID=158754 RepID=UPI0025ED953C|nr:TonB-dependent receptor [uncultured Sphingomonas sp.]
MIGFPKILLLTGASVGALMSTAAALAQTGPAPVGPATTLPNTDQPPQATGAPVEVTQPAANTQTANAPAETAGAQEIVVTARRQALQNATDRKRNSDTVIDSIVADDAGKLPDNSITEVLQRVPGVTIVRFASLGDPDRFSVEGSGIQVRGLSSVLATLNGREITGANGGGGLSWNEVTPELMAAVDVYKASTADRIEGGIGGAVDLRTKMPFDFSKPAISGTASGGYGDLSKKGSYGGSVLATDTWETGIGKIGILVDVAYNKLRSKSSFIRAEPYLPRIVDGQTRYIGNGFDYGQEQFTRRRQGFYEALQWEPASNLRFFQTAFISNYRSDRNETGVFAVPNSTNPALFPVPSSDAVYDRNGILQSASSLTPTAGGSFTAGSVTGQTTVSSQENETRDFSQGFAWDATSNLKVGGALQFIQSFSHTDRMGAANQNAMNSFGFDTTGGLPNFSLVPTNDLTNRTPYQWTSFSYAPDRNRARSTAANLDLTYTVGDGFIRQIQVGARYANRRERDNQIGTYWTALGRDWNGSPQQTLADGNPADSQFEGFSNFFKGDIAAPVSLYIPSFGTIGTFDPIYLQNTYGYDKGLNPNGPNPIGQQNRYGEFFTRVRNKAAYVQARFGGDVGLRFDGNVGLRVVRINVNGTGNEVLNYPQFYNTQADANADLAAGGGNAIQAFARSSVQSSDNSYTRFLPSFNLNLKPTDQLAVRMAVTRTMSLPDFISTRVTRTIGITTAANANNTAATSYAPIFVGFTADRGNPDLKPTMALNFDLSAEYYQGSSFSAHVALFHKRLKDLILYGNTLRPYSQTFTRPNGSSVDVTNIINANEVYNATQTSKLTGAEIGGRKFFDMLPAPFDGIGVEANYTYIDSSAPSAIARDINGELMSGLPIVGLSKHNYNLQLLYEKDPVSFRLAYSWRSKYLQTTNGNGTTPTYLLVGSDGSQETVRGLLPVYGASYGQLDGGITFTINDHLKAYVQGTNLTNAKTKTLMAGYPGGTTLVRSWFVSDTRYEGGINFNF